MTVAVNSYLLHIYSTRSLLSTQSSLQHINRTESAVLFFVALAQAALVLGLSKLLIAAGAKPSLRPWLSIHLSLGLAVACQFVVFGYGMYAASAGWRTFRERIDIQGIFAVIRVVGVALAMVAAWGVVVQAAQARRAARFGAGTVQKLVLAAGVVGLVLMWEFAAGVVFGLGWLPGTHAVDTTGLSIAEVLIGGWASVGAMAMVYLAGRQREGGVWSEGRRNGAKLERGSEEGGAGAA
jgi:hypothetical protein